MRKFAFLLTIILFSFMLSKAQTGSGTDVTSLITNPTFNGNVNGWTVNMPNAQNKGYQGSSYTNGNVSISQFAEAWRSNGQGLGTGSITQTISGLSDGTYVLEADVIACNQSTGQTVSGALLVAESDVNYSLSLSTGNHLPDHVSLKFLCSGGKLCIGLRTLSTTNANWVAMDNIKLTYMEFMPSDASNLSINPTVGNLVVGETMQLTADVATADALFNQVVWTSSDESVATVNSEGMVTANQAGRATITASAIFSDLTAQATITVEASHPERLVINEIQVANIDMFIDPSVNYGGWMELYNPTSAPISLAGIYIEDNVGHSHRMPLDAGMVPAGGFKTIWFDHYDTGNQFSDEAYKQVSFKLQYEGGVISVSNANHQTVLSQEYPTAILRCSYARTTDGGNTWGWTSTPSPDASNTGSTFAQEQLPMPVIDKDATVFTSSFTANVNIPAGATLRYTTDGSTPTLANGATSSTGRFNISSNTVLRLRLFQDGYLPSNVLTRTYIYRDKDYYLPIVSVVTADENLNDDVIGAYVDGTNGISGNHKDSSNKNRGWERPVNFEYLVPAADGSGYETALNQECDFEVCGGWSRHFSPAGSFRLKGAKQYEGKNFLPYPFFEEKPYIKNKTLQVRNGGNDNHGRIKDAAIHEIILTSGFNVDCQSVQPAHIFINGQYMFMFNLREPNNKNHGYSNYGIDTDEMDQFEINGSKGYEQKSGDDIVFRRWMSLAQQLANNPTNDALYQQICQIVDIDEYCNYMAAECYSGCNDWATNSNNIKGYRSRQDGKYHLIFMDQDQGFVTTSMIKNLANSLYDSRYDTGKNFIIDIFLNMLKNETFKKRFIDSFCLVNGSVFEPSRVSEVFATLKNRAGKAMSFDGEEGSMNTSANELENTINSTSNRNSRMTNLREYFGLNNNSSYALKLSSNISDATFLANGLEIPTGRFDGTFYAPMTLTAKAPAGYRFKGWMSDGAQTVGNLSTVFDTNTPWRYYDQGSLDGKDWKSATYTDTSWQQANAPFGYGNVGMNGTSDYSTTLDYGTDSNQKRPTYYFRKTITLDSAPTADEVYRLTYYADDGFVAYVNGTEIGRYLMDAGTPSYSQYSSTYVGSTAGTGTIDIDGQLLRKGSNVIAIEVHNTSATSSDIYWTAKLSHGTREESSYLSTDEQFDITTLGSNTATLVATYERMPDDELLAAIATPIKVNEVSAGNSIFINDYMKKNDWIELYNNTDDDLNVAGLYLSDDVDDPLKYQIPANTVANTIVPAHGHLTVWADDLSPISKLHTGFKLSNTDGQMVVATASDDFVSANADYFTKHPALTDFADALFYGTHKGDQSVGRYPDGGNTFYRMSRPTIEACNTLLTTDVATGIDEGVMETGEPTFVLDLAKGWNWMSHPMAENLSVNYFKDFASYIQGQTLEAYYSDEQESMAGLLKTLTAGQMYKVEMNEAHTYTFTKRLPLSPTPVALQPGWNWIGYPLAGQQTIAAALAGSKVDEGDVLMGQSGFATYSATDGWVGTLSSLAAGHGYMYKTSSTKSLHFTRSANNVRLKKPRRVEEKPMNCASRYDYPEVMAVIGVLTCNGDVVPAEQFRIEAYVDGECRGKSEVAGGKLFLTIYGEGGEHLSFVAVDELGNVSDVSEKLTFNADLTGTLTKPFAFTLEAGTVDQIVLPDHMTSGNTSDHRPQGFYTLSGLYAGQRADALRPGLYIQRFHQGFSKKVIIK